MSCGLAHMCRDGHAEIHHADSEHEQCPLCRAMGMLETLARESFEHFVYSEKDDDGSF
jgi:hypothetical protein